MLIYTNDGILGLDGVKPPDRRTKTFFVTATAPK
jgi:hypothetical protein